jgi:hypothetical protein
MDTATLRKEPMNAMRRPKKGTVRATVTVLITSKVLKILPQNSMAFLEHDIEWGKNSSNATAKGVSVRAYFAKGFTSVTQIAK